ncbi:FAST kinase domain-containing protein 2, mitochondrial [Sergentomyia squamirostris]
MSTARVNFFLSATEIIESPEDPLMRNIKYATDTTHLLDIVSRQKKEMQPSHVIETLKTIFVLQKNGNSRLTTEEILKHPHFEQLCRRLRSHSRNIDLNEIINSLKVMIFLKVPTNSEIVHILFNLLRHQVNDVELSHIVFLDFLLTKCERTPLVEAFKIALPMLFEISVSTKLDHENVHELTELLSFTVRHECSDKSVQNVVSALTLHGQNFSCEEAKSIVWSLCDYRRFQPSHERLLTNSLAVLLAKLDELDFSDVELILTKLTRKMTQNYHQFYNEVFFEKVIDLAIERDVSFDQTVYCFKNFNRVNYVSPRLMEFLVKKFRNVESASASIIFALVSTFSLASFTPGNWNEISHSILNSRLLRNPPPNMPWVKFALDMLSFNVYSESLFGKLFSDDFLITFLSRNNNILDHVQLLTLYQIITILHPEYRGPLPARKHIDKAVGILKTKEESPLQEALEYSFGGCVVHKAMTKHGHLIDHLVVFDADAQPIPVNLESCEEFPLVDIFTGQNRKLVAILPLSDKCYTLNTSTLKGSIRKWTETLTAIGLTVLPVHIEQWSQLPDHEKIPYLEREIKQCAL